MAYYSPYLQFSYSKKLEFSIPIYKLDLHTGEVCVLLSNAILQVWWDSHPYNYNSYEYVYLDSAFTNHYFGNDYYFPIFSKKYLSGGYFNCYYFETDYFNKLLDLFTSKLPNGVFELSDEPFNKSLELYKDKPENQNKDIDIDIILDKLLAKLLLLELYKDKPSNEGKKLQDLGYLLFCFKEDLIKENRANSEYVLDICIYGVKNKVEWQKADYDLRKYHYYYHDASKIPKTVCIGEDLEKEKMNHKRKIRRRNW